MAEIAGNATPRPRGEKMSDGDLKAILNAKVTNSLGYYGGKLSKARVTALQYYQGEPFGNELDGRSQVVSRVVAEAIDSMMPALMKIFTSGEEVVRFEPTRPEDEEIAKQATDYVNWIWNQQNEGFRNFHDWFKDALLNRTGAIKLWWDEQEHIEKKKFQGLTDEEFEYLLRDSEDLDEEIELLEHVEYPDPIAAMALPPPEAGASPQGGMGNVTLGGGAPGSSLPPASAPMPALPPQGNPPLAGGAAESVPGMGHNQPPKMLHDVTVRITSKGGRARVLPMPGEEFLVDRRAVTIDNTPDGTPFCAHRTKRTISDLLEMGYPYDKIKDLGEGDSSDFNLERLQRFRQEDELPYRQGNNYDPAMKEVWINECYLKVDYDGDGIAELRKITFAGESGNFAPGATVILDNEEVDDHPFAVCTPVPMPHKLYGMSVADQTMDLQLIQSTIFRLLLDHSYNAVMPQIGAVANQVNMDDLLTRRPGGVVRMQSPDAITTIPNGEMGVDPFQLISYLDSVREQRTGVQRFTAGPGADALNNAYTDTATGANIVENSSQERLELVARCFAEIGVKNAFKKILKLVTTHQNKPKVIRLRGKWVEMDPREWDTEFDVTVTVGLGTGNRQQQMMGMSQLLAIDEKLMAVPQLAQKLLTPENIFNKLDKLCQYLGLKSAEGYYTDPATVPNQAQPPAVDPHVQAAQIKAQADQQSTQLQLQADQQKTQAQMMADAAKAKFQAQLDREKMAQEAQLERERMQMQIQADKEIALAKLQNERELEFARLSAHREEFNAQSQLDLHKHATDTAVQREQGQAERSLKKEQHQGDMAIKGQELEHKKSEFASNDDFRKKTTPEYTPPKPKLKKIALHRGKDGRLSHVGKEFDDGTSEHVPIERVSA